MPVSQMVRAKQASKVSDNRVIYCYIGVHNENKLLVINPTF